MRRHLVLSVPLLLVANHAFGLVCTWTPASSNLWSDIANWSCGMLPASPDDCKIGAGNVVLDDVATASCRSLSLDGRLYLESRAQTLKVGNNVDAASDGRIDIGVNGVLFIGPGQTLEFNITNAGSSPTRGILSQKGRLVVAGITLRPSGVVSSFALPSETTVLDASRNFDQQFIKLTDDMLTQTRLDQYAGKRFVPISGVFRWQPFDIVASGTAPCTSMTLHDLCLDATSRGAFDTRNRVLDRDTEEWAWRTGDRGKVFSGGTATVCLNAG